MSKTELQTPNSQRSKVMEVTKSTGVAGKLELLQRNMVGATGRQVIGPIVMLSPGGLKQRHLMLLSQVMFWFVIAWLCII